MPQVDLNISVDQLRQLIGQKVDYHGMGCIIIEVLEDGPSLVLQEAKSQGVIQPDQYGEAHRRAPHTLTIPIFTPDKAELSPQFLHLDVMENLGR